MGTRPQANLEFRWACSPAPQILGLPHPFSLFLDLIPWSSGLGFLLFKIHFRK